MALEPTHDKHAYVQVTSIPFSSFLFLDQSIAVCRGFLSSATNNNWRVYADSVADIPAAQIKIKIVMSILIRLF